MPRRTRSSWPDKASAAGGAPIGRTVPSWRQATTRNSVTLPELLGELYVEGMLAVSDPCGGQVAAEAVGMARATTSSPSRTSTATRSSGFEGDQAPAEQPICCYGFDVSCRARQRACYGTGAHAAAWADEGDFVRDP